MRGLRVFDREVVSAVPGAALHRGRWTLILVPFFMRRGVQRSGPAHSASIRRYRLLEPSSPLRTGRSVWSARRALSGAHASGCRPPPTAFKPSQWFHGANCKAEAKIPDTRPATSGGRCSAGLPGHRRRNPQHGQLGAPLPLRSRVVVPHSRRPGSVKNAAAVRGHSRPPSKYAFSSNIR